MLSEKVCSLHFFTGKKSDDPDSVDFVPSIKLGYDNELDKPRRKTNTNSRTSYNNEVEAETLDGH